MRVIVEVGLVTEDRIIMEANERQRQDKFSKVHTKQK